MDAFLTLKVNVPAHVFSEYSEQYMDQLKKCLTEAKSEHPSDIYWIIHKKDKESLSESIKTAGEYGPNAFEDIIKNYDYSQLDENTKFEFERDLWIKLDKEKDLGTDFYKNLLNLDTRVFNSLQLEGA